MLRSRTKRVSAGQFPRNSGEPVFRWLDHSARSAVERAMSAQPWATPAAISNGAQQRPQSLLDLSPVLSRPTSIGCDEIVTICGNCACPLVFSTTHDSPSLTTIRSEPYSWFGSVTERIARTCAGVLFASVSVSALSAT